MHNCTYIIAYFGFQITEDVASKLKHLVPKSELDSYLNDASKLFKDKGLFAASEDEIHKLITKHTAKIVEDVKRLSDDIKSGQANIYVHTYTYR